VASFFCLIFGGEDIPPIIGLGFPPVLPRLSSSPPSCPAKIQRMLFYGAVLGMLGSLIAPAHLGMVPTSLTRHRAQFQNKELLGQGLGKNVVPPACSVASPEPVPRNGHGREHSGPAVAAPLRS